MMHCAPFMEMMLFNKIFDQGYVCHWCANVFGVIDPVTPCCESCAFFFFFVGFELQLKPPQVTSCTLSFGTWSFLMKKIVFVP